MRPFEIGAGLLLLGALMQTGSHTTAAASSGADGDGGVSGQPAVLPSIELPPALDRVLHDYERAWQARDPAALAMLFVDDGFVLANGSPPVRGRNAIRTAYAHGGGPLALRALAYETEGSVGFIIGTYGPAAGAPQTGKFVLAVRRGRDGRWLIVADMDNSNQRPPRPPGQTEPHP